MRGMDRLSGTELSGDAHLVQSIADIVTTPLGTRVMRRDYGSLLFELIDRPLTPATRLLCVMAVALAIARWEPRIEARQIQIEGEFAAGQAVLTVVGRRTDQPDPNALTRLSIPLSPST